MFVPCHFVLGSIYTSGKTVNLQSIQIGFIEGKPSPVSLALGRPLKPFLWTCLPWIYICKLSIIEVLLSSFFFSGACNFLLPLVSISRTCRLHGAAGSCSALTFSVAPRHLEYDGSHQCYELGKTEISLLERTPRR